MYCPCCRFFFFTGIFLWSSSDYLHILLYWRKNHKFFPNLREQNIQSFLTLCFFIEGKLSVICCVIIIQKEENTSRYIRPSLSCSNLGLWSLSDRKHIVAYAPLIFCFFLEGNSWEVLLWSLSDRRKTSNSFWPRLSSIQGNSV